MSIGPQVAQWLRENVAAEKFYDHEILLSDLVRFGISYDAKSYALMMATGEMVFVPTYTLAELVKHPVIVATGLTDHGAKRVVIGYEVAQALHALLWPLEVPPGQPKTGLARSYRLDVESIAQRAGLPYRDNPPGGWWQ